MRSCPWRRSFERLTGRRYWSENVATAIGDISRHFFKGPIFAKLWRQIRFPRRVLSRWPEVASVASQFAASRRAVKTAFSSWTALFLRRRRTKIDFKSLTFFPALRRPIAGFSPSVRTAPFSPFTRAKRWKWSKRRMGNCFCLSTCPRLSSCAFPPKERFCASGSSLPVQPRIRKVS